MIASMFYVLIVGVLATVITFGYILSRPLHKRDDIRSGRLFLTLFFTCGLLPYGVIEAFTRTIGKGMKPEVERVLQEAGIEGKLLYYKVLIPNSKSARVLAVAEEKESWGGMDHPTLKISMRKEGGEWKAESYRITNSSVRGVESVELPPYW